MELKVAIEGDGRRPKNSQWLYLAGELRHEHVEVATVLAKGVITAGCAIHLLWSLGYLVAVLI